jgi:hypothetical protein
VVYGADKLNSVKVNLTNKKIGLEQAKDDTALGGTPPLYQDPIHGAFIGFDRSQ